MLTASVQSRCVDERVEMKAKMLLLYSKIQNLRLGTRLNKRRSVVISCFSVSIMSGRRQQRPTPRNWIEKTSNEVWNRLFSIFPSSQLDCEAESGSPAPLSQLNPDVDWAWVCLAFLANATEISRLADEESLTLVAKLRKIDSSEESKEWESERAECIGFQHRKINSLYRWSQVASEQLVLHNLSRSHRSKRCRNCHPKEEDSLKSTREPFSIKFGEIDLRCRGGDDNLNRQSFW